MSDAAAIAGNVARIRERIAAAVARRGPGPEPVLIGAAKTQPLAAIQAAVAAGLGDVGENYAQELRDKVAAIGRDPPRWHFIGALQRNKVRLVVGQAALIHTVDRPALVEALGARAAALGVVQEVLVEVNLAGEAQKAGAREVDLPALLDAFAAAPALRCRGLMIIPPGEEPGRPYFARLREVRDRLVASPRPGVALDHLSMGMSGDFEAAIEEGATMVRVGTAIFGARAP